MRNEIRHPFYFQWRVAVGGFQWARGIAFDPTEPGRPRDFLVAKGSARERRTAPLDAKSGLFRTFADVAPTKEGILAFANEHGFLGGATMWVAVVSKARDLVALPVTHQSSKSKPHPVVWGESLSVWFSEIERMRALVHVWGLIEEDVPGLAELIQWSGQDGVMAKVGGGKEWIATREINPEILERFTPGDLMTPALYYLQRAVNRELSKREHVVPPRLLWVEGKELELRWAPPSLIAALWLQFAMAIEGDHKYRLCRQCKRWFRVGPGAKRPESIFCTPGCKQKSWRKK